MFPKAAFSRDIRKEVKVREVFFFFWLRSPDAVSHPTVPGRNPTPEPCYASPAPSNSQLPHLPCRSHSGSCLTKFSQATSSLEGPEILLKSPSNLSSQKFSRVGANRDEALIKAGDYGRAGYTNHSFDSGGRQGGGEFFQSWA